MDIEHLFTQALGIEHPWQINGLNFDSENKRLDIQVDFKKGSTFKVGDKEYKAYDTVVKTWRHLNFFEHECYLNVKTPRVKIENGKVKLISPSWSGLSRGFTLLFEALILQMCRNMPINQAAKILKVGDKKLWQMLDKYVEEGLSMANHSQVNVLGIDETSLKRGHNYISLFVDLNAKKTIHIGDGRDSSTVVDFKNSFIKHSGKPESITDASCDMSPAFIKGVSENFPNANITFDKFHILKIINEGVDQIRRSEAKWQPCLKGARFAILKNDANLSSKQKALKDHLSQYNLKTMRAVRMREAFQSIYSIGSYEEFKAKLNEWYFWASHSKLAPMIKVAKTIKKHLHGILQWQISRINNGILEGLNSIIQAAKRKARGYKIKHFKTIAFLLTGRLNQQHINPYLPTCFG
jgi:transposase